MSVAEKFWKWWHENWSTRTGSMVLAAYRAGYDQGYADAKKERKYEQV